MTRYRGSTRALGLAVAATLLGSLAGGAKGEAQSLTPLTSRTSDQVIARDLGELASLDARLADSTAKDRWRVARARALVGAARNEYLENDRTGFDGAAFAEAARLANEIAGGAEPAASGHVPVTEILSGTVRVRDDLWTDVDSLKASPGFDCALEEIARAEVELLWAGNEQVDQGDCHSSPHLTEAERLLREAHIKAQACQQLPPVALRETPRPAPPPPTGPALVPPMPTPEEVKIPRNVHFALNRYSLSARSHEVIAGIVQVLLKYPSISVRLEGHTDSRASAAYNLRLSKNRVDAVRNAMVEAGVTPERMTTTFKGEEDLKVTEDSKANFARNRRVEMVFVDYEGHDIQAEEQEEDLQVEPERAPRPAGKPSSEKSP